MSRQRSELEYFVKTILNQRGDKLSKEVYEEYADQCKEMVRTLEITEKTIAIGIKLMADEIFLYPLLCD